MLKKWTPIFRERLKKREYRQLTYCATISTVTYSTSKNCYYVCLSGVLQQGSLVASHVWISVDLETGENLLDEVGKLIQFDGVSTPYVSSFRVKKSSHKSPIRGYQQHKHKKVDTTVTFLKWDIRNIQDIVLIEEIQAC